MKWVRSTWLPAFFAVVLSGFAAEGPARFAFAAHLLAPVRVHLLTASNAPHLHTTLNEQDIARILGKVNAIWAQAGVGFYLESLVREEAVQQQLDGEMGKPSDLRLLLSVRPESSKAPGMFHIYFIKQFSANGVYLGEAMFVKDSASLKKVPGGIDEPIPRVTSHELGHALSLQHRENSFTNLLSRGTTGTWLAPEEIAQARAAAQKFPWIRSAAAILNEAGELYRAKKFKEAQALYARVASLPLDVWEVNRARTRAGKATVTVR